MNNLQSTKSLLAKLLANENITVSHQPVKTAYFDLQSRTLVCPVWQDMDGELYDLLMGHEVGHATETPTAGWHNALLDENGKPVPRAFKDFLNVLEDARIEKKIKRRYPGLAKSFANAYKSLHERDFFGIRDMNINEFNFIDRINVYCKLGAHVHVQWKNDWEREILDEVNKLETWEEVVELAKKIFQYVKEEEQPEIQNEQDLQEKKREMRQQKMQDTFGDDQDSDDDSNDDSDGSGGDYEDEEDSDDSGDDESDGGGSTDGDGDVDDEDESVEDSELTSKYNRQMSMTQDSSHKDHGEMTKKIAGEPSSDEPESVTDRAYRRREQELVNASGKVFMLNLPNANLDRIILSNKIVMDDLETFYKNELGDPDLPYGRNKISYETLVTKCVKKFNANNKKFIMHIFKEFDMRKRATDYARTSISRSGELNMNLLHKYKYSNDIFKKIAVIQKGKNHGLIMFVDMSGSMADILKNTMEQTLVLVAFCKLANIPFDVYGFSNDVYNDSGKTGLTYSIDSNLKFASDPKSECSLDAMNFHLKHLIGSSLSSVAYRRSFNNLAILVNEYYCVNRYGIRSSTDNGCFRYDWTPAGFGLNGTPYIETLLASREMIKKFRVNNKLDIVNVLYLTDGDGNTHLNYPNHITWRDKNESTFYLVDKKTQRKVRKDVTISDQVAITKLVQEVTGCKHLGFYLADKRGMKDALARVRWEADTGVNKFTSEQIEEMRRSVKENNFFAASSVGYDKYFFVTSSKSNIEEDKLEINASMTKNKMANAFKKSLSSKKSNRLLVSKFAEELAVGL